MKKILPIIIVILLVATLTFVACDDSKGVKHTYELTVSFQPHLGQVTTAPPANGEKFVEGEVVVVTISPNAGYMLDTLTLNGTVETEIHNNQFIFNISQDSVIEVTFKSTNTLADIYNDNQKGTIVLSAPQNSEYAQGELVTLTATANEHFTILSCVIDGVEKNLVNNACTFTVGENKPVIRIEYIGEAIPQAVLSSLQNNVKFEGDYYYDINEGSDTHNHILTVFGNNIVKQIETDAETGKEYYSSLIKKSSTNPRAVAFLQRNLQNQVEEITDTRYYFSDYSNQFDIFSTSDFEYVEENTYKIVDADKAKRAASAITGWNESIESFLIIVDDNIATGAIITTERIDIANTDGLNYVSTYTLTISEHGTAQVDENEVQPYAHEDSHDALKTALDNAVAAPFYTVRHFGHEVGYVEPEGGETRPGYGDNDYYVYVTQDMVYDSFPTEEHGFKVKDGYVYPFNYEAEDDRVVLLDPIATDSIESLQALFIDHGKNGYVVELFQYVGDGKYVLRDDYLAGAIAPFFAEGYEVNYYIYAENLAITIKDNKLYKVEFTYLTYGIHEEVTLTYDFESEINLPLNFDDASKESVLDPFKGTYADVEGNYVVVDSYGFTINGIEAEVYSYSREEGIFTLIWNNLVLYAQKLSTKQMILASDDYSFFATVSMLGDQMVQIPSKFKGVWAIDTQDDIGEIKYHFEIQSYVVKLDGNVIKVLSYTEQEGLVCEDDNNNTYNFFFTDFDGEQVLTLLHVFDDGTYLRCYLDVTGESIGIEIPIEFVGTYLVNGDYAHTYRRVDITTSSITIDGVEFVPTAYDQDQQLFTGKLGNMSGCQITFYGNTDHLVVFAGSTNEHLYRTEVVLPTYIGTWQSTVDANDPNDTLYIVEITETSICINGEYVTFTKDEYGYTFEMITSAFTTHILYFSSNTSGKVTLWMYDNNYLLKSLTKVGGDDSDIKFPSNYVGTWSGVSSNGKEVTFEITNDTFSISIDGESAIVDAVYDDDAIIFTYDDVEYIVFSMGNSIGYYTGDGSDYCMSMTKAE